MARTLFSVANISIMYWCFAVIYAVYIINWLPTYTLELKTPFEAYTGNKPSIAHLQIFSCKAYVHVPQEKHQKLNKKTLECIYLGYSEHKKAFVLLHHSSGCIIESRDMHFDKSESIEPNQVRIEMEATKNKEKIEVLLDQEEEDSTLTATSSDELTKVKMATAKRTMMENNQTEL